MLQYFSFLTPDRSTAELFLCRFCGFCCYNHLWVASRPGSHKFACPFCWTRYWENSTAGSGGEWTTCNKVLVTKAEPKDVQALRLLNPTMDLPAGVERGLVWNVRPAIWKSQDSEYLKSQLVECVAAFHAAGLNAAGTGQSRGLDFYMICLQRSLADLCGVVEGPDRMADGPNFVHHALSRKIEAILQLSLIHI